MKKLVLALTAAAAFTGSAIAADLPARTYSKAPAPVAYAPSWTGCYVGGGGGYGLWTQETTFFAKGPPGTQIPQPTTGGGRGYFGTVQAGCDYQFPAMGTSFVVGAFGDYDFSSLKANVSPLVGGIGQEKIGRTWPLSGGVGWVALPSLLPYFSG